MLRVLGFACCLAALVWVTGCATTGASAALPDAGRPGGAAALTKPTPPGDLLLSDNPAETYERARVLFAKGAEEMDAKQYDRALAAHNQALALLMKPYDRERDPATTKKIDALFFELCLAQLRLGRLTGRYAPAPVDRKLIGIDFNPEVERWLGYFTLTGRGTMERYLARANRYLPMIKQILKEEGVPEDLAYLPIIESGYSNYAYSRAAAVGMWQFIAPTGKRYGLVIDDWVDERRDPAKSTRAAARYLRELHGMFDDWALALAGYNCGENGVSRAIGEAGVRDFWRLNNLPGETTNYVPKFFAAALIARDPEMYGVIPTLEPPLELEAVELAGVVELKQFAEFAGLEYEDFKALNPELLGAHTPPYAPNYRLNVPKAKAAQIKQQLAQLQPGQLYLDEKQLAALKKPEGRAGGTIAYRVKRGDTLASIAARYHTTAAAIRAINPRLGKYLKAGMRLRIPVNKRR